MVYGRHEHQEPPRHRRVRGQPGAFRAERLLGHLDDDLLPFLQQVFDLRLGALLAIAIAPAKPALAGQAGRGRRCLAAGEGGSFVSSFEAVELLERRYDVGDVEEAVAFEAEINKRRLHAGQHLRHPALV